MSRNGSGTYSLPAGNPVVTGTTISSTWANNTLTDIATALTQSIASDGQTTPTANLPMGNFKHTSVAVGASLTDYARYDQLQNSSPQWLTSVAGVDTITASAPVTPASYASGQTFRFVSAGSNTGAVTLNVSSLGAKAITKNGTTALSAGDIPSGSVVSVTYDGTQFQLVSLPKALGSAAFLTAGTSANNAVQLDASAKLPAVDGSQLTGITTGDVSVQDFRLTLSSGVPVTTADVTGATTIYCTPYKGNSIGLYNGTKWNIIQSAEFSLSLGTLTSGLPYDVFCYDNAGTPTLEFLAWTNATTRATALVYQDGILVKSGVATRRYLGTFYTTSTTQTEDSATKRLLWNYYNRVQRKVLRQESTSSWTYTTATYRQANNSAANQISVVRGLDEDNVTLNVGASVSNASTMYVISSIGLDSTSSPATGATTLQCPNNGSAGGGSIGTYSGLPGVGYHYYAWLEWSQATGTTTWYGISNSGIYGSVLS